MPIAFRAVTDSSGVSTHTGAATPVACPAPTSRQVGDVLLATIQDSGTSASITTPSGWTIITGSPTTSSTHSTWMYARVADGTSTDDFSATITGPASWLCDVIAYSGCDVSNGLTSALVAQGVNNSGSTTETTHTSPSVTTSAVAGCALVGLFTEDSVSNPHAWSGNSTSPSIGTPVVEADVNETTQKQDMGILDALGGAASTAYTMLANLASAEVINCIIVVLAPAPTSVLWKGQPQLPSPSIMLGLRGPGALVLQLAYVRALIRRRWISPPSPVIPPPAPPLRVIMQGVKRRGNY